MSKDRSAEKQARKATEAQKIALEKQLVKEGKILPRTRYAPKSFVGRVLAVALAFLLGIFAALGGLLGAGYYAGTRPLKDVFGMFNFDYSAWLTDSAADMSILQLTQELSNGGMDSLGDLAEYTPYVDTLVEQLNGQLSALGVTLDAETLKATPFSGLGEFFADTVRTAELGKALGVTAQSDPLMLALCYGVEGTNEEGGDYTVNENGEIVMNDGKSPTTIETLNADANGILGKVSVEAALDVTADSNSSMRYLAYGTEGESYRIVTDESGAKSVEMLTDPVTGERYRKKMLSDLTGASNVMGDAAISDVIVIDENTTGLLAAVRDWKVDDLGNSARLERLRLSQVITIGDDSSNIMKAMRDWRIGDLTDQGKIDSLTLGDVIAVTDDSPEILKSLRNTRLGELSQATEELRLTDLLGNDAVSGNRLLRNLAQSSVSTLAHDVENLTVGQVYGDQIYSYLDLEASGGKTYAQYIKDYDPSTPPSADQPNTVRPAAIVYDENSFVLNEKRVLTDGSGTEVFEGWFYTLNGVETLVPDAQVHRSMEQDDAGLERVRAYARTEVPLTATAFAWTYVDYQNDGALTALPAGDRIYADTTGYSVEENGTGGTPVTDADGAPLYYLTERILPAAEGEEPASQLVAYPLLEDANGIFVRKRMLNEGDAYSVVQRVDLERAPSAYAYGDGSPVTLDEQGNAVYEGQSLPIQTRDGENGTQYFLVAVHDVTQKYYYETAGGIAEPQESETQIVRTASWTYTPQGEPTQTYTDVPVERFLSGTWYLVFGGEDESGAPVDKTDTPILAIAPEIGETTQVINQKKLWELYLHGVINDNPYVDLTSFGLEGYTNLNLLNVSEVISFLKELSAKINGN